MDTNKDFDTLVFEAIMGHDDSNPQDLIHILSYVEGRKDLIMTHQELSAVLQQLIDEGRIAEVGKHRFIENPGHIQNSCFSGYTYADHQKTYLAYDQWLLQQMGECKRMETAEAVC